MIRVTINDEPNIQEFITYFVKEKRTLRVQDNIYDYELKLSNIIKIEKQVKDLTLEECNKLGVNIDTYGNYYELNGKVLHFNDYIDITSLIKGD